VTKKGKTRTTDRARQKQEMEQSGQTENLGEGKRGKKRQRLREKGDSGGKDPAPGSDIARCLAETPPDLSAEGKKKDKKEEHRVEAGAMGTKKGYISKRMG